MKTNFTTMQRRLQKMIAELTPKEKTISRLPYAVFDFETNVPLPEYQERVTRWNRAGVAYKIYGAPFYDDDGIEE